MCVPFAMFGDLCTWHILLSLTHVTFQCASQLTVKRSKCMKNGQSIYEFTHTHLHAYWNKQIVLQLYMNAQRQFAKTCIIQFILNWNVYKHTYINKNTHTHKNTSRHTHTAAAGHRSSHTLSQCPLLALTKAQIQRKSTATNTKTKTNNQSTQNKTTISI